MSDIYYTLGLFIAFFAEQYAFKPNEWRDGIKAKIKTDSGTWDSETSAYAVVGLCYIAWIFIGLASNQWPVFLLLLVMGLLGNPLKKFAPYRYADAAICIALVVAMVINHFHLKINPLSLLQ